MLSPRARSTSLRVNCAEGSIKTDSSTPLKINCVEGSIKTDYSTPLPLRLHSGLKAISARNDETGFSHMLLKSLPIKYFFSHPLGLLWILMTQVVQVQECFTWNIKKEIAIVKIVGSKKRKWQKSEANKRKKVGKLRNITIRNIVCCYYIKIYIVLNC